MQDRFDDQGRTRSRRFAAMPVPATAVAGAIVFDPHGRPGGREGRREGFGQQADTVVIKDVRQVVRSTHAGIFNLTGLTMKVDVGADARECS
ncbi:DUF6230 family protein [Micromonospora sp. DT178]|uniref:DUF6230 family protein n=1 Tax=Micromonospora sp. DT178 TaxID=3393436 RepID=UPI003CEE4FCE